MGVRDVDARGKGKTHFSFGERVKTDENREEMEENMLVLGEVGW